MAAEKKKDWASGEEYSVTAVRSDGRGPTQEQINKNLGQTQNTAASTAAVSPTTTNTNQTQQNQQTAQRTMQTSTAVSNAAGNPPAVNTAALRQQAANVTANKAKYANTEQFKTYLADWLANAQQQQTNRIDYATRQGVNALNQAAEEANAQYATQQTQIDADEARARDNQALYAAARGDRGGIGAAQYDSIANTAMQNRVTVQNAQTKMATDTARQIADLRAQGEYEKADALLNLSQQYLSQLMSLEQWAQQYNLNVDQFNAQLDQWAAEYNFQLQQADLSAWQWQTQYNRGVFESDRAYDYQVGRRTGKKRSIINANRTRSTVRNVRHGTLLMIHTGSKRLTMNVNRTRLIGRNALIDMLLMIPIGKRKTSGPISPCNTVLQWTRAPQRERTGPCNTVLQWTRGHRTERTGSWKSARLNPSATAQSASRTA